MPATVKDLMTVLATCEPGARIVARHDGKDLDLHAVVSDGELRSHFATLLLIEDDPDRPALDAAYCAGKARLASTVLSAVIRAIVDFGGVVDDDARALLELAETRARLMSWLADLGVTPSEEGLERLHLGDVVDRIRKEVGE